MAISRDSQTIVHAMRGSEIKSRPERRRKSSLCSNKKKKNNWHGTNTIAQISNHLIVVRSWSASQRMYTHNTYCRLCWYAFSHDTVQHNSVSFLLWCFASADECFSANGTIFRPCIISTFVMFRVFPFMLFLAPFLFVARQSFHVNSTDRKKHNIVRCLRLLFPKHFDQSLACSKYLVMLTLSQWYLRHFFFVLVLFANKPLLGCSFVYAREWRRFKLKPGPRERKSPATTTRFVFSANAKMDSILVPDDFAKSLQHKKNVKANKANNYCSRPLWLFFGWVNSGNKARHLGEHIGLDLCMMS